MLKKVKLMPAYRACYLKERKKCWNYWWGGKDYKAIAEKLFVSNNTIRTHYCKYI